MIEALSGVALLTQGRKDPSLGRGEMREGHVEGGSALGGGAQGSRVPHHSLHLDCVCFLGAVCTFLELFCGHLSPKGDKTFYKDL